MPTRTLGVGPFKVEMRRDFNERELHDMKMQEYEKLELVREQTGRLSPADRAEYGATGTVFFGGLLTTSDEEYNSDLQWDKGIRVYDRMWRGDGQVAATLRVLELPLLAADWTIEPASEDQRDVDIAQFVHDNIFGGLTKSWEEILEELLTCFRYGFSLFELVWEYCDDGFVRLKKLAPRQAKTIYRWFANPDDELDRVEQRVYKLLDQTGAPTQTGGLRFGAAGAFDYSHYSMGTYQYITIPGPQLALFTIKREGNNFAGISVLRHAYKHWYYKDGFYKIDAIANERQALGVPTMEEPQGATAEERDRAAAAISALHAHEKGYMLVPHGWNFKFADAGGSSIKDIMPSIEHHDLLIARSVLAQFLNMTDYGSYARSEDETSFFLQAQHAVADRVSAQFNRQIIKKMVDYNFEGVERYPSLQVGRLDKRKVAEILQALPGLVKSGIITRDTQTENTIRRLLDFPDLDADAEVGGGPSVDNDSPGGSEAADPEVASDGELTESRLAVVAGVVEILTKQVHSVVSVVENRRRAGQSVDFTQVNVPMKTALRDGLYNGMLVEGAWDTDNLQLSLEIQEISSAATSQLRRRLAYAMRDPDATDVRKRLVQDLEMDVSLLLEGLDNEFARKETPDG